MGVALLAPQTGTYIFRSCVFRRCGLVLAFSMLTFSTLANSYLRLQYLHIPSSGIAQFHTSHFHTRVFQYLHFERPNHWRVSCHQAVSWDGNRGSGIALAMRHRQ